MIERAARCLETGGRTAFRGNKKHFRSQRHLHSAFWNHGAGNIDLPAWWIFLLQTPASTDKVHMDSRKGGLQTAVPRGLGDIFLDFLYPLQTLALIKKIKRSTTAHHLAAQNVKQYARSYTSIAQEFITGAKVPETREDADSTPSTSATEATKSALRHAFDELVNMNDHTGLYDELWRSYQDLLEMSFSLSPQELVKLLRCLMLSSRAVDVERALALFESIPVRNRRAIHYSHAVSAALALKDVDTAVLIHREALSRINGSIGTAAILRFAVQQELWNVAIETWHTLWEHKLSYYTRPDMWAAVDALPIDNLISKASSAADFAITTSESTQGKEAAAAREFALELARRAFGILEIKFNDSLHWNLIGKVRMLDDTGSSRCSLALEQLLSVGSREHGRRALRLYRLLRKNSAFSPSRKTLSAITRRLFIAKSTHGIVMIMDDWRTYFAALPARYALKAAKILAHSGHVEAIEKLLNDFISEHGKPKHDTFYHCLLLAHSRRADTEGMVRCLNHLQEAHGFIPDVKAWNSAISTYARVGDVDGASAHFRKLREIGLRPDSTTYFILMSMYGKRGDRDAVDDLYEQSKVEGIPLTVQMVDAIVLANINDENMEEAERLVEQAIEIDTPKSRTFMWNILINAYAVRKEVEKVSQLHKRMREIGTPSNNMTYAALMTSLTVVKYPDGARKIMDTVMPRNQIKPTTLHYAIVMGGYLLTGQYSKIFVLYKRMLKSNLSPNISTQNVLLRAAAAVDKATLSTVEGEGDNSELIRAKQTFEQTLANLDPMELAASEPRMFVGINPLNEAFSSTYFEYLIFLHGTVNAFEQASELYERYITTRQPLQGNDKDIEAIPPMRLLSALMVSLIRAEKHAEVDRCWNLALEKSEQLACKHGADTFRRGWVLHSRRFIINLPLHQYIISLTNQDRTVDLIDTVKDLHYAGYALNSSNWNKYIQALARSPQLAHRILAFQLCESELMPNWGGWAMLGDPKFMKLKLRAAQRDFLLKQDQKAPTYLTLVWLARTYLEARSQGKGGTMRHLEKVGRRTVDAVINMPRLNDRPQSEILRQET